ncbi:hypothetical protein [Roseovarius sp. D0-M9]|uniref:hypothetical protein n=1 Tax=Roseovarius sp. D0-M9 TaxID=3127117 RepID=UPI0030101A1B
MSNKDRTDPAATLPRTPNEERAEVNEASRTPERSVGQNPRHRPARPDPETGEVPAGPGDAGLQDHPDRSAGSPGTKQMSNKRLGLGLGIAALLAVLVFALMF